MIICYIVFYCVVAVTASKGTCELQFTISGETKLGGKLFMDCLKVDCGQAEIIIFEKTEVTSTTDWTPVYDSRQGALDTKSAHNSDYTLKRRSELSNSYDPPRLTLSITDVIIQDYGSWRCTTTIGEKQVESASRNINILEACEPQLAIIGNASVDSTVYIDCRTLHCDKADKIQFEKTTVTSTTDWTPVYDNDKGALDTGEHFKYTLKSRCKHTNAYEPPRTTLIINYVIPQDQGSWRCVATKDGADYFSESKDIPNIVKSKVKEAILPKDSLQAVIKQKSFTNSAKVIFPDNNDTLEIFPNDTFTLTCKGTGNGYRITWHKDGNPIINNHQYVIQGCESHQTKDCTSTLTSIKIQDESHCQDVFNYIGVYTCVAQSDFPVKTRDESVGTTLHISNEPVVIGTQGNTTCLRCSNEVVLRCDICARNPETDKWYHNGEEIPEKYVIYKKDGIIISSLVAFGQYQRKVTTKEGEQVTCNVQLIVKFEPCVCEIVVINVVAVVIIVTVGVDLALSHYCKSKKLPKQD